MTYLIKLNIEELGVGAAFGLAFWPLIGWWAVFLGFACAILWAIGGSGWGRAWRFVGCPAIAFIFFVIGEIDPVNCLKGLALSAAVLTMGYGIPDPLDRKNRDEGSFLGRIFFGIFRGNELQATLATRAVYALLLSVGPVLFIPGSWPWFVVTVLVGQIASVVLLEGEIVI